MANCDIESNSSLAGESVDQGAIDGLRTTVGKKNLFVYSYITNEVYEFEAYIYKFNFSISADIKADLPFGRSSRIYTYGGTNRNDVKIDFYELIKPQAPNEESKEAIRQAIVRAQKLMQAAYPSYVDPTNTLMMQQAPLVRIFHEGFITNGYYEISSKDPAAAHTNIKYGLLGYISNLSVDFDRSDGGAFEYNDSQSFTGEGYPVMASKISYALTFAPIEDGQLGFKKEAVGVWDESNKTWPLGFMDPRLESPAGQQVGGSAGGGTGGSTDSAPTVNEQNPEDSPISAAGQDSAESADIENSQSPSAFTGFSDADSAAISALTSGGG